MSKANFSIYKSSAGSGKTFTLVKEYLKIALNDDHVPPTRYKGILAITFTNKAAAEMKERIIKALLTLSKGNAEGSVLESVLLNETSISKELIRSRSINLLNELLHNYSSFSITTIDSFIHSIVRSFSQDLGLSVNFNIVLEEDEIIEECVDQIMQSIGENKEITDLFLSYVGDKVDDGKSWQIDREIKDFIKSSLKEGSEKNLEHIKELQLSDFIQVKKKLQLLINEFDSSLSSIGKEATQLIQNAGLSISDFFQGNSGIGAYFRTLENKEWYEYSNFPNSYVLKAINDDIWYGKSSASEIATSIDKIKDKLKALYFRSETILNSSLDNIILAKNVAQNVYAVSLLNEVKNALEKYKSEENVLLIKDFNQIISNVVRDEPVPFVYEKIGSRYHHYLLDEAQDTSKLQFQNLLPLITNALAENHFNLAVGDGKQSIYRWRGGDAEQFNELPNLPLIEDSTNKDEWGKILRESSVTHVLEFNYRSKGNIINFNNEFFQYTIESAQQESFKKIYFKHKQKAAKENTEGLVTLDLFEDSSLDENLFKTLELIIKNREAGFSYSQLCILVSKNKEGNKIANFLTKNKIPVVSSDSLLLNNNEAVQFTIHVLQFINDNRNKIALGAIANFIYDNCIRGAESKHLWLFEINQNKNIKFIESKLKEAEIDFSFSENRLSGLYDMCLEIIMKFNLEKNHNTYVRFFLDEVQQYSMDYNQGLSDFLVWWDKRKASASLIMPEGVDAVRIMTIHKSKGLEFDVVLLPFCNWKTNTKTKLWVSWNDELPATLINNNQSLLNSRFKNEYENEKAKQFLDALNLLYVALTRAAKHLHIIAVKQTKQTSIYDLLKTYCEQSPLLHKSGESFIFGKMMTVKHTGSAKASTTTHFYPRNRNEFLELKSQSLNLSEEKRQNKKEEGIRFHQVLSEIKTKEDIEKAINKAILKGFFNETEGLNYKTRIQSLVTHPAIKEFFDENLTIKNECPILKSDGAIAIPDKVIFKKDETIVLDFKSGQILDKHKQQITEYAELLMELGYPKVRCILIKTDSAETTEVLP